MFEENPNAHLYLLIRTLGGLIVNRNDLRRFMLHTEGLNRKINERN